MADPTPTTETKPAAPTAEPAKAKADSGVEKEASRLAHNQEIAGATPAPAPKPPEEREARRAALLKKEAERVASQRAEFEASRKQQETEVGDLRKQAAELAEIRGMLAKNPLQALTRLGLDYDSLITSELERQELDSNPAVKEVRELKARLADEEKQRKDAELRSSQVQHQRLVDTHVARIQAHIDSDADKYEFLKTAGAAKDVFGRIKEVFDASIKKDAQGNIVDFKELTVPEACDLLESEYEESWKSIAGLKKVGAFFNSQSAPPSAPDKNKNNDTKNKGERDAKSPVLSNSNTSGPVQTTRLSKKEKSARAFEAMRAAGGH